MLISRLLCFSVRIPIPALLNTIYFTMVRKLYWYIAAWQCTRLQHQNCLHFLSPTGNIYFNKIAQHCVCAKSEHPSLPLNTAAERNALPMLLDICHWTDRQWPTVTWSLNELRPHSGSPQDPGSGLCQDSHLASKLSLQTPWFRNSFKSYWKNQNSSYCSV